MKITSTHIAAAACIALVAACGGNGGNAALSKSFNYGAAQAPSTSEQSAAGSAQASLSDTTAFSAAPDASKGLSVIAFADLVAAGALGGAAVPGLRDTDFSLATREATTDACSAVAGNTVTFTNCSVSFSGLTITFSGTVSVSAGAVSWNIS